MDRTLYGFYFMKLNFMESILRPLTGLDLASLGKTLSRLQIKLRIQMKFSSSAIRV